MTVNYPSDRNWPHFGEIGGSTLVESVFDGVVGRSR